MIFLQCPVLIAWGDKDPWEPIEIGRNYRNFDSVEDFIVLPNVGHCPQVVTWLLSIQMLSNEKQKSQRKRGRECCFWKLILLQVYTSLYNIFRIHVYITLEYPLIHL